MFSSTSPVGASHDATKRGISAAGVALVLALHAAVVAWLVSAQVISVPAPIATLTVDLLTPAAPPQMPKRADPPRPKPVAPRPQPPQPAPPTLAAQTPAPTAAAETFVPREAPPTPPPIAAPPAPAPVPITQPRFDVDYLDNPAPAYPPMSRRLGETGKVVLRVQVDAGGRPTQIQVHTGSGSPRLDQAAQDAVWRWKFVPARQGDQPVAASVLVPIVFSLKG